MKKIGFFGDGIWAEKTLNKLLKIKNYKISFICLRFSNPDKNLIKIAKCSIQLYHLHQNNV